MVEMTSYTIEATRSGRWWILEEPTLGCVSQVHHLSEATEEMVEAIAYQTGIDESEIAIEVKVIVPDDISERMDAIETLREESRRANAEAAKESRSLVASMRQEGFTLDDIGRMLGLTKGRVSQLTKGM